MHSTITRSLATLMLSLTPTVVAAQPPARPADSQEPIPRELALALLNLGPGMGGSSDIRIGRAPDDLPAELLMPGLEVLGSTTQFESSVIVLAAPQAPDSAISVYEAHLLASGWTKPPAPRVPPMRGFVSADVGQFVYERPNVACKGDGFATYAGTYRRMGGSLLKITYNRGTRYSMCKNRADTAVYRSTYDEAPVPILRAPFGTTSSDGNGMSSSGNNSFTVYTRLSTRLKPGEVVAHYDKQMREQGWTSLLDGTLPFLAARTYRRNDDNGRPWVAMLFSAAMSDSLQEDVSLKLTRGQASVAK